MSLAAAPVLPIQIIDLPSVYQRLKPEIDAAIQSVLDQSNFINGQPVKQFTSELSEFLGGPHVVPCGNGTDALQIAYMALDLKPGDQVIMPAFNYVAAAEAASLLSLKPVFVDSDPYSFNMDPDKLRDTINPEIKAIVVVHLFGQATDMEAVMAISEKYGIPVIEDNAQAIGAEITTGKYAGKKLGTIGHVGTTSFFPSKNLGGMGDGGAITTTDDVLFEKIKMICNHGQKVRYYYEIVGVNSRLDTIQAAILSVKLRHLNDFTKRRQNAADRYDKAFKNRADVFIPARASFSTHVFHQYTLMVKDEETRNGLKKWLMERGIQSMIYYPNSIHLQPGYTFLNYSKGDFPIAEMQTTMVLSLPMHSELKEEVQSRIIDSVLEYLNSKG